MKHPFPMRVNIRHTPSDKETLCKEVIYVNYHASKQSWVLIKRQLLTVKLNTLV